MARTVTTMYLASLDHSPSEQLGKPDDWHTTVLILSEAAEHWTLAQDVARDLGSRDGQLRKWSRNPAYRRSGEFERALKKNLPGRGVYVRTISAQARTIRLSYSHMIEELRLNGLVEYFVKNDKPYLRFGPFQRIEMVGVGGGSLKEHSEPAGFEILERQGLALIFICHYLLRMHQRLLPIIQNQRSELEWIDWQLMPNRFPGDVTGPMSSLFHAIMSGVTHHRLLMGSVRIVTFEKSSEDLGSALADNIAGLCADKLRLDPSQSQLDFSGLGDVFDWEIWSLDPSRPFG